MKIVHTNKESILRTQAYKDACEKYKKDIASIQKYIPGWLPKFTPKSFNL